MWVSKRLKQLPIITLTTDLGYKDHYVAAVKGAIYKGFQDAIIVDISNDVKKFDYGSAAFLLRSVWSNFPVGTIHINAVENQLVSNDLFLGIKYKGHYFIGPDNGVFSLVLKDEKPDEIFQLNSVINFSSQSFPLLDVLVPAACRLAKGNDLSNLGVVKDNIAKSISYNCTLEENRIIGRISYIDNYGNCISNISKFDFDAVFKNKPFQIRLKNRDYYLNTLSNSYHDLPGGEILVLMNSLNLLEISQSYGNAEKYLGLKLGDNIHIEKDDNKIGKAYF